MKKLELLFILGLFSIAPLVGLSGQDSENSNIEKQTKWLVGSDVDLAFGSRWVDLEISPFIGYRITKKFEIGLKIPISLANYLFGSENKSMGIGLFSRYYLSQQLFLYTDYGVSGVTRQSNNLQEPNNTYNQKFNADFWNVGFGFRSSGRLGIEVRMNYNIINNVSDQYNFSDGFNLQTGISYKF